MTRIFDSSVNETRDMTTEEVESLNSIVYDEPQKIIEDNIEMFINKKSVFPEFIRYNQPGTGSCIGAFAVEGRYLYGYRLGYLYKIDVGIESQPDVVNNLFVSSDTWGNTATSMIINGDYIYIGCRDSAAGYTVRGEYAGLLAIVDKTTFTLVNSLPLSKKISHLSVYGTDLYVNGQMFGWQIYDIINPIAPSLVYNENFEEVEMYADEFQGSDFLERDGKTYYFGCGYSTGIMCYDVTDTSNVTRLWYYKYKEAGGYMYAYIHTHDIVVDYPYMYVSIGPKREDDEDINDRWQGVIVIEITDINVCPIGYNVYQIPNDYKCDYLDDGDAKPTSMIKVGNNLILGMGNRGVAVYRIKEDGIPEYYYNIELSTDSCVYKIEQTTDGRLFAVDGNADSTKPARRIYMLRGVASEFN